MTSFPFTKQFDAMDCGSACLRMVAKYHGKTFSLQRLREQSHITREGVSLLGISDAAENIGFRTMGVSIPFEKLKNEVPLPCIVHWLQTYQSILISKTNSSFIQTQVSIILVNNSGM